MWCACQVRILEKFSITSGVCTVCHLQEGQDCEILYCWLVVLQFLIPEGTSKQLGVMIYDIAIYIYVYVYAFCCGCKSANSNKHKKTRTHPPKQHQQLPLSEHQRQEECQAGTQGQSKVPLLKLLFRIDSYHFLNVPM